MVVIRKKEANSMIGSSLHMVSDRRFTIFALGLAFALGLIIGHFGGNTLNETSVQRVATSIQVEESSAGATMIRSAVRASVKETSETSSFLVSKEINYEYIHDDPNHVWHWTREHPPCPKLSLFKKDCAGKKYIDLYHHFHSEGWVTFTSCSLKKNETTVLDPVTDYCRNLTRPRASTVNLKGVKDLALDPDTVEFIEYIHGGHRRAFPFQTLNFKVGTQQGFHSDLTFFDTEPRTLMAAAWVALEDINPNNGPLMFVPKSHRWGIWDYEDIGLSYNYDIKNTFEGRFTDDDAYYAEIPKLIAKLGLETKVADTIKRGQTFIWAAGLLHGGSTVKDASLTRMSQVSHYFFEGAKYYWNPKHSNRISNNILYDNLQLKPCRTQLLNMKSSLTPAYSCADGAIEVFKNFQREEL